MYDSGDYGIGGNTEYSSLGGTMLGGEGNISEFRSTTKTLAADMKLHKDLTANAEIIAIAIKKKYITKHVVHVNGRQKTSFLVTKLAKRNRYNLDLEMKPKTRKELYLEMIYKDL